MFNLGRIDLLWKIDLAGSSYNWVSDGEVQITLKKDKEAKVQYWKRLVKNPAANEQLLIQTWWKMKDEHIDFVEDLLLEEKNKGLHQSDELQEIIATT